MHCSGGVVSNAFEFVVRCPIRFFLGVCPRPAVWNTWSDLNEFPVDPGGVSGDASDALVSPRRQVVEHHKPISVCGEVTAYSPKNAKISGPRVLVLVPRDLCVTPLICRPGIC